MVNLPHPDLAGSVGGYEASGIFVVEAHFVNDFTVSIHKRFSFFQSPDYYVVIILASCCYKQPLITGESYRNYLSFVLLETTQHFQCVQIPHNDVCYEALEGDLATRKVCPTN